MNDSTTGAMNLHGWHQSPAEKTTIQPLFPYKIPFLAYFSFK